MQDFTSLFPQGSVSIEIGGPPTYVGHRVVVAGNPDGFRWLAQMLLTMANDVDDPSKPAHDGWHFMLNGDVSPQLRLEDGWFLSLNCER